MKRFLLTFAAMLLTSMCAFAQGESNEPLKGDVNGDGKVDVADITAIIAIIMGNNGTGGETKYYWYLGYNQNAYGDYANFKSNMYTTDINSVPTQYSKDGDTGFDLTGTGSTPNYMIMILPSSWQTPILWNETKQGQVIMPLEYSNVTIKGLPGTYNIYSTPSVVSATMVYIN